MDKNNRTITGRVSSSQSGKSITVTVERLAPHPLYGKYVRKTTSLRAHDESGCVREGDLVTLKPSRPISKTKSWLVVKVVEKNSN